MDPLVSIIVTSYNSIESYLKEAINSVITQTYKNFELIVVDDGSTNGVCKEVCREIVDPRLAYIRQENKGLPAARNFGVAKSRGEYICFLDDDDRWKNNKIEVVLSRFREYNTNNKTGLIFSDCNVINEAGEKIGLFGYKVHGDIYEKILGKNIIGPPSSVMIKRFVFNEMGGFNEEYRYAEDIELWYRITRKYDVESINIPLIDYRYRKDSLSKNYREMGRYCEKALDSALANSERVIGSQAQKHIRSKFYKDFAYLFFSNNDPKMYRSYYLKAMSCKIDDLFDLKLQFGLFISFLGRNGMARFNRIRNKNKIISNNLSQVIEIP